MNFMMGRRPGIIYKLECINKFNVVVLINLENNFENNFFLKIYLSSLFMTTPFLATLSVLFVSPHVDHFWKVIFPPYERLGGKYGFLIILCIR